MTLLRGDIMPRKSLTQEKRSQIFEASGVMHRRDRKTSFKNIWQNTHTHTHTHTQTIRHPTSLSRKICPSINSLFVFL